MKTFFILVLALTSTSVFAQVKPLTWTVSKDSWSNQDEKNFSAFVQGIGRAREKRICLRVQQCLNNQIANPMYFAKNNPALNVFSDCADLPFIMRAYFAWMNDLPFSYPTGVSYASDKEVPGKNINYTVYGNKITKRTAVKTGSNIKTVIQNINDQVSSAAFRVSLDYAVTGPNVYNDFYGAKISPKSIVPGTVFYNPSGHVLLVYEVTDDGQVFFIDAHPDNSLSRKIYDDKQFIVSSPKYGAGFKNWRPVDIIGGKFEAKKDSEIENFSNEQYFGTVPGMADQNWRNRQYTINGTVLPFGEFVRQSLAKGNLTYEPVKELRASLKGLCDDLRDRKDSVVASISKGIHLRPHPLRLPENIYGDVLGDWESYSTPSRDTRLRASIQHIQETVITLVNKYRNADPIVVYEGHDLVGDLTQVYTEESHACKMSYTNSAGLEVGLDMDQIIDRIYALSFDPYNCIELRWGATISQELASCRDDINKKAWYNAEQNLRNSLEINYDITMNRSLEELPTSGLGIPQAVDLSLKNTLQSLR